MIEDEVPETVRGDPEISLEIRPGIIENDRSAPDQTTTALFGKLQETCETAAGRAIFHSVVGRNFPSRAFRGITSDGLESEIACHWPTL